MIKLIRLIGQRNKFIIHICSSQELITSQSENYVNSISNLSTTTEYIKFICLTASTVCRKAWKCKANFLNERILFKANFECDILHRQFKYVPFSFITHKSHNNLYSSCMTVTLRRWRFVSFFINWASVLQKGNVNFIFHYYELILQCLRPIRFLI